MTDTVRRITPRLVMGGTLILIGLLLVGRRFGFFPGLDLWDFWPLILVAMGLRSIVYPRRPSSRAFGAIVLVLGVVFFLRRLGWDFVDLGLVVPLAIVAAGATLVWRSLSKEDEATAARPAESASTRLDEWAAFGGGERRVVTDDFEGGEVSVAFGGFDVDLRGAILRRDEVTVDVFVLCGGTELKVPEGWNVVLTGVPLLGGFEDKSIHPPAEPPAPRMVVRGWVILGGLEVRN